MLSRLTTPPSKGGHTVDEVVDIADRLNLSAKGSKKDVGKAIITAVTQPPIHLLKWPRWFWGGILPTAEDDVSSETVFLLGQEQNGEWGLIGGGRDQADRSPLITAAREGYEEMMGFLGDEWDMVSCLKDVDPVFLKRQFALYQFPITYDSKMPVYFKRTVKYFSRCSRVDPEKPDEMKIPSCPSGYYELIAVDWFTKGEIMVALEEPQMAPFRLRNLTKKILRSLWSQ